MHQLSNSFTRGLRRGCITPSSRTIASAFVTVCIAFSGMVMPNDAEARDVPVRFRYETPDLVVGFRIYVRTASSGYASQASWVGKPAQSRGGIFEATVPVVDEPVYVRITAFDGAGQSVPSIEHLYEMPASDGGSSSSGGGGTDGGTDPGGSAGTGGTADGTVVYRLNSGGPDYTDSGSALWVADDAFVTGGNAHFDASVVINGTPDAPIYRSQRSVRDANIGYELPVPNGRYRVRLHNAEFWNLVNSAGDRVFDVIAEGLLMLDNFDIYAEVGANQATVQEFEVDVADGSLTLTLAQQVSNPRISGVEVFPVATGGGSTGGGSGGDEPLGVPGTPFLLE